MNRRRLFSCLSLALAALLLPRGDAAPAPAPKAGPAVLMGARFKQTRERIEALYHLRDEAPPPPDPRHNPFRDPEAAPAPGPQRDDAPKPAAYAGGKIGLVQQSIAALKLSGVFEVSGRIYGVINGRPYKQGDSIKVSVTGGDVFLVVREISKRSVTLALDGSEITLKF
jgi:hypothetical protein